MNGLAATREWCNGNAQQGKNTAQRDLVKNVILSTKTESAVPPGFAR